MWAAREETLKELRRRGLSKELYKKYRQEAIDLGLIPVPGQSRVGGRIIDEGDILTKKDVLEPVEVDFTKDRGWYGIGI